MKCSGLQETMAYSYIYLSLNSGFTMEWISHHTILLLFTAAVPHGNSFMHQIAWFPGYETTVNTDRFMH
jgi:hypothetical protein